MTLDHVRPLYSPYTFISPLTMSPIWLPVAHEAVDIRFPPSQTYP